MFGSGFHHPLDNLIKDDSLFMMEALIPFVDDRLKAPLAIYIKVMELRIILEALKNKDTVDSCGLHKDINSQEDILSSLSGFGFSDVRDQFDKIKTTMGMMNAMESMKKDPDYSSDLYGSMQDLFDEYDKSQKS